MRICEMWKVLEKEIGERMRGREVWYALKFDRQLLMPFAKEEDIVKLVRGNDDHT